jgi:hypothetical protein
MDRDTGKGLFSVLLLVWIVGLSLIVTGTGFATEGGGGAYPNGVEDFLAGALPPPGTYYINEMLYYTSDTFRGTDGDELFSDFKVRAFANSFRFLHMTKKQVFGAQWGVQAIVPVVYVDVTLPFGSDRRWGLGDLVVDPFILGWHSKNLHVATGIDVVIPVGTYDKDRLANAGRNYWTIEPIVAATFLTDSGFEISAKVMYDFNTKNTDTGYRSGQEFHMDYAIGYHLKQWTLGLSGYLYSQTTGDELHGQKVGTDGFKGRVISLGPTAKYDHKNTSLILKWQPEFEAKNRPEGNTFWFKFLYAF